ncbi:MAG: 2-oxo acid dehydrogenase subunit E2 [Deltaproteobacteria bacterium]|nr:2-oxo acid dehydrogenase subunit E2 [Deltaproteobacteria bacterium]
MPKDFIFPDLGEGVAEGELVKWLVKEGDSVKEDQDVAEVETDKALVSIPSPHAGVVEKLHFKEGDKIPVGAALMSFRDGPAAAAPEAKTGPEPKTEPIPDKATVKPSPPPAAEARPDAPSPAAVKPAPAAPEPKPLEGAPSPSLSKLPVLATPHTRKLARELGVDIETVRGSGENGRVTEDDVRRAAAPGAPAAKPSPPRAAAKAAPAPATPAAPETAAADFEKYGPVQRIPIKGIRRKISEHMLTAAHQTVMVTHIDEAEVDALMQLRQEKKKYAEERGVKLTLLPFLMKACVIALRNYPYLNASLSGDEIVLKDYFHFGFAVDTEAGLMVPVIRDVDQKSIMRLATELVELSEQARNRSIPLEALKGHSFSITNIGSIGGRAFTPILHYPDSAILGLGRTYQKPVVRGGEIKVSSVLPLCLTFDHRVTDGATAARFTNEVIKYLSDPDLLLLDDGD